MNAVSTETRKYELKARAESQRETRERIARASAELHEEKGVAHTTVTEIARRAGVTRLTVYNHFADLSELLPACAAHYEALHPQPDLGSVLGQADPDARVRDALARMYAWYRETEPMTANVLRDAQTLPALRPIIEGGLLRYLDQARQVLIEPIAAGGRRRDRLDAAARAAVDFHLWRALAPLGDAEAAELAAGLVELAAGTEA